MKDSIKVTKILVMQRRGGPDLIYIDVEGETMFPGSCVGPCFRSEVLKGHGVEWVRKTFGREPDEVIMMAN